MLMPDLIESEAFLRLSGKAAMLVLIRFYQKAYWKHPNKRSKSIRNLVITNNGEIIFTYGEAKELGIRSPQTFYKVIRELVEERGLIDITEHGNWYLKQPTKFAISGRWRKYGTPEYERVEIPRLLLEGSGFKKRQKMEMRFSPSKSPGFDASKRYGRR